MFWLLSIVARLARMTTFALVLSRPALAQLPTSPPAEPPPAAAAPAPTPTPAPAPAPAQPVPAAPVTPSTAVAPERLHPVPAKAAQLIERPAQEPAAAEEGDLDAEPESPPRRVWYGWQTLTSDGLSLLALLSAASLDSGRGDTPDALIWAGVLGYEFAPGILHFVHRNPGRAFASFGLRLGMPLAGAVLGAAFANCDSAGCRGSGAGVGFLLGMGGAITLDAAVFAYESPPRQRAALLPLVVVTPQGAVIGVGGSL